MAINSAANSDMINFESLYQGLGKSFKEFEMCIDGDPGFMLAKFNDNGYLVKIRKTDGEVVKAVQIYED